MKHLAILMSAMLVAGCAMASASERAPIVNEVAIQSDGLPRDLEEFGFFKDAPMQIPTVGVTSYRLNTPLFSDGAQKDRFVYVPSGETAQASGDGLLDLPVGSALIKTFSFGEGADRRLVETRVLLHREDGWLALPYRWNEEQTQATLALAGARVALTTPSGEEISYRIPNKNQCKECHGLEGAVVPIGPKARNLSREWLSSLAASGHLDRVPEEADQLPLWGTQTSDTAKLARAYLDVNCAHCHRPGATASNSGLDLRWEQQDLQAIGIMKRPVAAGRGAGELLFDIVPGKPEESILLHRMNSPEPGVAMPELGKSTVDREGVRLVERWIAEMQ